MEERLIVWFIGFLIAALWGLLLYLIKKNSADIHSLKDKNEAQELKIQHLNDKLWGEEKLTKVIVDAVRYSMTEWENKMLKSGLLHQHERRKDDPTK